MSGLKFTLSLHFTNHFYQTICLGLKKLYSDLRQPHEFSENEQMQMAFTTDEFLELAIESWSEWHLNPQPLNFVQTLKPTDINTNIYMYICIYI